MPVRYQTHGGTTGEKLPESLTMSALHGKSVNGPTQFSKPMGDQFSGSSASSTLQPNDQSFVTADGEVVFDRRADALWFGRKFDCSFERVILGTEVTRPVS